MSKNSKHLTPKKSKNTVPKWQVYTGIGLLLLIVGMLFFSGSKAQKKVTPEVTGAPGIKVNQEKIDYGDVKLGTKISTVLIVTNVGDQQLLFKEAPYIELLEGC